MSDRATCWSVTINNPVASDDEYIARAKQRSGWSVTGQREQGENGTEHYQLMVKTPQTRFSSIKKAFPRAHIEVARNVKALAEYVQKEDTRVGSLPSNDKYPSLTKLWDLFDEYLTHWNISRPQMAGNDALYYFDLFIAAYIEKGYHIETMGVNPQIRSAVKRYLPAVIARIRSSRSQTDRQTADNNTEGMDIDASGEEDETSSEEAYSETEESEGTEESDDETI